MPASDERLTQSEKFAELWTGASSGSHAVRNLKGSSHSYVTCNGAALPQNFADHLAGKFCLVLVPINEQYQCRWASIDIDDDTIDHLALVKECACRRMPVIVCRSKSGGAHALIFFRDAQPARSVQRKLQQFAEALGFPNAEVFPKQEKLVKHGNGLALPYPGGDRSTEYAVRADGTSMPLSEFIEAVARVRVTDARQLDDVDLSPEPSTEKPDKSGTKKIREGSRVNSLVSRIGRLSHQHVMMEGIQADISSYNEQFCDPPLTRQELEQEVFPAIRRYARPPELPVEVIPLQFTTPAELLNSPEADDTDWLIKGLVPRASHNLVTARPKEGKSLTLQQLCFEAALGKPVFGSFQVAEPIRCLYADYAQGRSETRRRHVQMIKAYQDQAIVEGNLTFQTKEDLRRSRTLASELADLGNSRSTEFMDWLVQQRIQLLVIAETRSLVKLGGNLKDQDIAELVNGWVEWLQSKTGITVIAIHHSRKAEAQTGEAEAFGSTMLTAAPDAIIGLKRLPSGLRRVHLEARFDAHDDFLLRLKDVNGGKVLQIAQDPDEELNQKIRTLKQQGLTTRKIAKEVGISQSKVSRRLEDLGLKEKSGRKKAQNKAQMTLSGEEM